ncbi:hypothetical protein VIBNIAM115_1810006 [Vibrio nigripulchritudo AM115]|nr:hypothetical protein VIBNIAM115_1810006 [Vibrio nigripulchritudo AM115]
MIMGATITEINANFDLSDTFNDQKNSGSHSLIRVPINGCPQPECSSRAPLLFRCGHI